MKKDLKKELFKQKNYWRKKAEKNKKFGEIIEDLFFLFSFSQKQFEVFSETIFDLTKKYRTKLKDKRQPEKFFKKYYESLSKKIEKEVEKVLKKHRP
jgi:hypothetical protein